MASMDGAIQVYVDRIEALDFAIQNWQAQAMKN